MLSRETESKLADVFLRLSSSEQQVESARLTLSSSIDFDVYSTFRAVDRLGLGSVSSSDLLFFLDKHSFYATTDEIYLSIKQYDSDQNGRLSLDEFHQLVLPSTDPALKSLGQSRRGVFTREVEYLFVRLLQAEVSLHRAAETARKALSFRFDFSPLECFKAVDVRGLSYIDRTSLLEFLRRFRYVSEDEVDAVFRRSDNDGDNLLTYKEFSDTIVSFLGDSTNLRFSSPSRADLSSFRRTSPLRNASPLRESLNQSLYSSGYQSPRRSSPLRNSSPLRESQSSSFLRRSLYNSGNLNASQSLRESSPRRSSPLRNSRPVPTESLYRTSPLRSSNLNVSSRTFGQTSANLRTSSPLRKSSPLRSSSPSRQLSPSRSFAEGQSLSRSFHGVRENPSLEENELVFWFQDEIKISREVEGKKNDLALRHDFNLIDAFRMFDRHDFGCVALGELEETFRLLGFYASSDELYLLVKHYSHLQNSRLSFADFSEMLSPKQEEYARILRNRNSANASFAERLRVFGRDTLDQLLSCFRSLLDAETLAERVRQRLSRMPEFSLHQAFVAIDRNRNGFITIDEFQSVLQSHGIFATGKDLQVLLGKYDKNRDGRVTYSEFVDEVTPKSPRRF